MKAFLDFLPILLFFVAYKLYDIYTATAVAIVASLIQLAIVYHLEKRLPGMLLASTALIVLMGGATLLLHDELFIKWKPTIVNWVFAAVFIGSLYIGQRPLLARMMDSVFTNLPVNVWQRMTWIWAIFFIAVGLLNLWVAYTFDTDTWVNFKLVGLLGLTIVFVIGQSFYLASLANRYAPAADDDPSAPPSKE